MYNRHMWGSCLTSERVFPGAQYFHFKQVCSIQITITADSTTVECNDPYGLGTHHSLNKKCQ